MTYTYTFTSNGGNPGELLGPGLLPGMPPNMGGFPGDAAGGPGAMDLTNLQARPYLGQNTPERSARAAASAWKHVPLSTVLGNALALHRVLPRRLQPVSTSDAAFKAPLVKLIASAGSARAPEHPRPPLTIV